MPPPGWVLWMLFNQSMASSCLSSCASLLSSTLASSLSSAGWAYLVLPLLITDYSSGPTWPPPPTPCCCPWLCVIFSPSFYQHLCKLTIQSSFPIICSFRYIFAFTFGAHSSIQWTRLSCFFFEFSLETTPQIFHTASNWLTLALAVQRYIYVCNPALAKRCCTINYARVLVMGTVVVAVMHMVPRTLDRE